MLACVTHFALKSALKHSGHSIVFCIQTLLYSTKRLWCLRRC